MNFKLEDAGGDRNAGTSNKTYQQNPHPSGSMRMAEQQCTGSSDERKPHPKKLSHAFRVQVVIARSFAKQRAYREGRQFRHFHFEDVGPHGK